MAALNTQERHKAQLTTAQSELAAADAALTARVTAFGLKMSVAYATAAEALEAAKTAAATAGAAAKPKREAAKAFLAEMGPLGMQRDFRAEMVQALEATTPSPAKPAAETAARDEVSTPQVVRKIVWNGVDVSLDPTVPATADSDILSYLRDKRVSPLLSGLTPAALADQATAKRALLAMSEAYTLVSRCEAAPEGFDFDGWRELCEVSLHPARGPRGMD